MKGLVGAVLPFLLLLLSGDVWAGQGPYGNVPPLPPPEMDTGGGSETGPPPPNPCPGKRPESACSEGSREQRWYFDMDWFRCIAVVVPSCETNEAFHSSLDECEMSCRPMDGPTCSGPVPPADIDGPCGEDVGCPAGYHCQNGAFEGTESCCSDAEEAKNDAFFSATCSDGAVATPAMPDFGGAPSPLPVGLVAFACDDLLCPEGFRCQREPERQFFARCCRLPAPITAVQEDGAGTGGGDAKYGAAVRPPAPPPAPPYRPRFGRKRSRDPLAKLRAARRRAHFVRGCRDKDPRCAFWAAQTKGALVLDREGRLARLPKDHCEWNPFLRTMAGCPLSCGTCTNRRRRHRSRVKAKRRRQF